MKKINFFYAEKFLCNFFFLKGNSYDYPQKDFCLFKDFPHNKLVMPIIKTKQNLECSCTLMWLLKYKSIYEVNGVNPMETDSTLNCLASPNFDQLIKDCDFNAKLAECNGSSEDKGDGFKIATIVLSITTILCIALFGFTIYFFKFRNKESNDSMSFSTFAASNKKIIISS